MVRSGDEPSHARSPLRLRLTLALVGALAALGGAALLWAGHEQMDALIAAGAGLLALANAAVVVRHLRTGPHYQPGRNIPPYRPVDDDPNLRSGPESAARAAEQATPRTRQRRYLVMMGICLFLITNAWVWVRLVSVPAAVVMSLIASVIPPLAAITANAGWDQRDDPPPGTPPDQQ
jgi:hypothetical protein